MKNTTFKKALLLVTAVASLAVVIPAAMMLAQVPPARPTGLWAFPLDAGVVELAWADNATTETGFKLQRATDPDFARDDTNLPSRAVSEFTSIAADAIAFLDTTTIQRTIYYYRIAAVENALQSRFSNIFRLVTPLSSPSVALLQSADPVQLSSSSPTLIQANVNSSGSDITGLDFGNGATSSVGYQLVLDDAPGTWDAQEIYNQFDISVPTAPAGAANNATPLPAGLPAGTIVEFQIEGTVASIAGTTWNIGSPALTVYESVTTQFIGARHPVAGDAVEIYARRNSAGGPLVATKIWFRAPAPQVLAAPALDITFLYNGTVDASGIVGDPEPADGIIIGTTWSVNGILFHIDDQQFPAFILDESLGEGSVVTVRFGVHQTANVARQIYSAVPAGIPTPLGTTFANGKYVQPDSNFFYSPENVPSGTWLYYIVDGVVTYADPTKGYWVVGEEGIEVYEHFATSVQLLLNDKLPGVGDECIFFCRRTVTPGPLVVDHIHPILDGPLPMKGTAIELHLMFNGPIQSMGANTWVVGGQTFIVDDPEDPCRIDPMPVAAFNVGDVVTVEYDHLGDEMPYEGLFNPMSPMVGLTSATINLDASMAGRTGKLYIQAIDDDQHGTLKTFNVEILNANVPAQPQGLVASLTPAPWTPGVDAVVLNWTDAATNETGYRVYRAPDVAGAPGTFVQVGTDRPAGTITYSDTTVSPDGSTWWYKVVAFNTFGESAAAVTSIVTPEGPFAPSNLVASLIGPNQIDLTWNDNSANEDGFRVQRSPDNSSWATIFTTAANVTAYSDMSVAPGNTYYYRILAFNGWGESASNSQAVSTSTPNAPSLLNATPVSPNQIDLTWQDNSNNEDYFFVERAPDVAGNPGTWVNVSGNIAGTSWSNIGLAEGVTYWYRVIAHNVVGDSAPSNQDSATTLLTPGAPSNLVLLAVAPDQVNLQWTENNPDTEDGYYVYRAPQVSGIPGTWTLIFTTGPDISAYADTTAAPGTTYYYRVAAFSGGILSAFADASPVITPALPVLSASAPTSTSVNLTWGDVSYEDTYMLERSTNGTTWTTIAPSLAQNTTSYGDTVPVAGTYYYRLTAQNGFGNFVSNTATVTTIILPTNAPLLSLVSASTTSITVSWVDNAAAETNFRVYYRVVGSGVWTLAAQPAASAGTGGTVTYTRPGTYVSGRNYEFRVAAVVGGVLYFSNIITFAIP